MDADPSLITSLYQNEYVCLGVLMVCKMCYVHIRQNRKHQLNPGNRRSGLIFCNSAGLIAGPAVI